MAQQVEAIANTLLELGRIKGQGAANQGQIWGNTLAGLGQIPQQIQQGQARQQDMQLRQQEMGLRGQELQIRQGQIAQQQRGQEDQQSLDAAMQAGILQRPDGSYAPDRQKISDYLVTNGKGHILPSLQKSWAESDEIQAKAQKAKREAADAEAEDIAAVATRGLTLLDHGASAEDAAGVVLPDVNAHGKNGIISPDAQRGIVTQLDAAKSDPVALRTLLEGWRNASKTQSAALKDRAEAGAAVANTANRAAELPGIQAKAGLEQKIAAGASPTGITAAQMADDARQAQVAAATQANQTATRAQEQQRINLERQRLAKGEAGNTPEIILKPGTQQYRVAQDVAYGTLTMADFNRIYGRAMGNAGTKQAIYDTARQLNPDFNPAQFELGFKIAGNPQIRQRLVAIDGANQVIDKIKQISSQVKNGDVQMFNRLLQGAKLQISNKPVANFTQLRTLLGDELGIALGVGTGSDLKTKLGLDLVNTSLSDGTFQSTMDQVESILGGRKDLLLKQMGPYAGAAGGNQPPATNASPAAGSALDILKARRKALGQ